MNINLIVAIVLTVTVVVAVAPIVYYAVLYVESLRES